MATKPKQTVKPVRQFAAGGAIDYSDDSQAGLNKRLDAMQQTSGTGKYATVQPQTIASPVAPQIASNPNTLMRNQIGEPQQTGGSYQFGIQSPTGQGAQFQFANQTMAEKSIASGINPNAAYKPGGIGDPRALGIMSKPAPVPQYQAPARKPVHSSYGILGEVPGFAQGGKISGQGTSTSDSINAFIRETGEQIKVSTGERIVSAKQEVALQKIALGLGFGTVDSMFEAATGKPVGPTIKAGKRAAEDGKKPDLDPTQAIANLNEASLQGRQGAYMATNNLKEFQDIGAGIVKQRGQDGKLNITNVDTSSITDAGKALYTAPDGSGTNTHTGSQQHQQGVTDANTVRNAFANMRRMRLETDAYDPSITDPNVRASARQQLNDEAVMTGKQNEAYSRSLDNQVKQNKIAGEGRIVGLQSQFLNEQDPVRRNEIAHQIRVLGGKGDGGPSLGQQSDNMEIDAARRSLDGMSPDEIKRKTANYTSTGRENPDYDPMLERSMKLAARRKVGADDHFDQRQQPAAQQPPGTDGDYVTRFRADKAMQGHKIGKQTDLGYEVLDASGKVVGHYR